MIVQGVILVLLVALPILVGVLSWGSFFALLWLLLFGKIQGLSPLMGSLWAALFFMLGSGMIGLVRRQLLPERGQDHGRR